MQDSENQAGDHETLYNRRITHANEGIATSTISCTAPMKDKRETTLSETSFTNDDTLPLIPTDHSGSVSIEVIGLVDWYCRLNMSTCNH